MRIRVSISILLAIVFFSESINAQQTQDEPAPIDRLQMDKQIESDPPISIEGIVKERGKYSVVLQSDRQKDRKVTIDKDTVIQLRVSNPNIEFEKKQIIVAIEGVEKRYRAYPITPPLYVTVEFNNRKKLKRIEQQEVKRVSDYKISVNKPVAKTNNDSIRWTGRLAKGETNRQHVLETDDGKTKVILAKRGLMDGFNISNLLERRTALHLNGNLKDDGTIHAKSIVFWPIALNSAKLKSSN